MHPPPKSQLNVITKRKMIGLIIMAITIAMILASFNKQQNIPLPGKLGLKKLMEQGVIRRANQDDMDNYYNFLNRCLKQKNARHALDENTYVILRKMNYPLGLLGGNSAIFILGHGIQKPLGDPGHSEILDMNISCY